MRPHGLLDTFPWPLAERREQVGSLTLDLLALEDFEATTAALYGHVKGQASARVLADLSPMFGVIWGSSRAIAARVHALGPWLRGRRVLELGCGLALPSMVAAHWGARVLATDQHPATRDFLERNLERNGLAGVDYRWLDWREPPEELLGSFDLVLASDVLFARELPPLVARAFHDFLGPRGRGWLGDPGRSWLGEFEEAARALGFEVTTEVDRVPLPVGHEDYFVLTLDRPS